MDSNAFKSFIFDGILYHHGDKFTFFVEFLSFATRKHLQLCNTIFMQAFVIRDRDFNDLIVIKKKATT